MLRKELKKEAEKLLHRKYGAWSLILIPVFVVLFVLFVLYFKSLPQIHYTYFGSYVTGGSAPLMFIVLLVLIFVSLFIQAYYTFAAVKTVSGEELNWKQNLSEVCSENFSRVFIANLKMALYTIFWSLLLVVPGIVKAHSYAMTNYLLKKNPELNGTQALTLSRKLMNGYKMEFFIFSMSFYFWNLLAAVTWGIAGFYVLPYVQTAQVLFFDQIIAERTTDGESILPD